MRPYLVLSVVLLALAACAQQPVPHPQCYYGCGPFVPLPTTPMVSFQQYSANPVGASNATTGLIAGATNSTVSQTTGNTNSVYTVPVWYQGGDAPRMTSAIHLWAEPVGHGMHAMRMEHSHGQEARAEWIYYSASDHTANAVTASVAAKSGKKAGRTYTNDDVERQNQGNGTVKYQGKTEKI